MRVALINGSPKRKNSASEVILGYLTDLLKQEHELINIHLNSPTPGTEELGLILGCDAAVWAFPLYVDGIPSHLIPSLLQLQELNAFVNPNFPRLAYKLSAENSWRKQIRANGLRIKDLGRRTAPKQ